MDLNRTLAAAITATALLLPGCLSPDGKVPVQANAVLIKVNGILDELQTSDYRLVSASLEDSYIHQDAYAGEPARDFLLRHHTYLYVDPVNAKYRQVEVTHIIEDGAHDYQDPREITGGLLSGLATLPPLGGTFNPSNVAQLESAVSNLAGFVTLPSAGSGQSVGYWLSAIGGTATWTLTYLNQAGTYARSFVDAASLASVAMGPKATLPGSVAINRPDLNATEARWWADLAASAWTIDASLIGLHSTEGGLRGPIFDRLLGTDEKIPTMLLPPDIIPADGLSPVWAFLYYSPSKHMVKPVAVYSTLLAVPGNEQVAQAKPTSYSNYPVDYDRVVPSEAAAAHLPAAVKDQRYEMGVEHTGPSWIFGAGQTMMRVDAYTGALMRCVEC